MGTTAPSPSLRLRDGHAIPRLGLGVWKVEDAHAEAVVGQALAAGYRHIDTAHSYGNEGGVGRAVAASGLAREELFITTKLINGDQGYGSTLEACQASLGRLGLRYLDLYLIHWLQPKRGKYLDTWRAMVELQRRGLVRSIGVANFTAGAIAEITAETGVAPAVHQVETHPYFSQRRLREFAAARGILHQAWSPLAMGGKLLKDPVLAGIAAKHAATPAQVVLAWHLALGHVAIPKTVTEARMRENLEALGLVLDPADIEAVNRLDNGGRLGADPATADFFQVPGVPARPGTGPGSGA